MVIAEAFWIPPIILIIILYFGSWRFWPEAIILTIFLSLMLITMLLGADLVNWICLLQHKC